MYVFIHSANLCLLIIKFIVHIIIDILALNSHFITCLLFVFLVLILLLLDFYLSVATWTFLIFQFIYSVFALISLYSFQRGFSVYYYIHMWLVTIYLYQHSPSLMKCGNLIFIQVLLLAALLNVKIRVRYCNFLF